MHKLKILLLLIILFSIVPLVQAETITLNSLPNSNQNQINEALKSVYENGGGTVHLNQGLYYIDYGLFIGSNTILEGDHNAIVTVAPISIQWFIGRIGLISPLNYPLKNVGIGNFQINGNLVNLPKSYANSGGGDHNAQRAIYLQGTTTEFMENISVYNMQIYDCYSDAIHIQFAQNVNVFNNLVSNCQHSGIFFVSVINGVVENNQVAGIVSDCLRYDNCVNNVFRGNFFYSYTGDNSNGQYQGGENGVQIADQGYSHGGGSDKPTSTKNIEGYNNTFANTGLRAVWIDSSGKGVSNVYLHDNIFLTGDEISTYGKSVNLVITGRNASEPISFDNPPAKEISEKIFSSIFDILNVSFVDTGITNQTENQINYTVQTTEMGKISGGVKIVGFKNIIQIDNKTYISDNNCTLVKTMVFPNPLYALTGTKIDNDLDVKIENGTANATLTVKMKYSKSRTDPVTRNTTRVTKTSRATFTDSCPAPEVFKEPQNITGIIYQYPTYFTVRVPSDGLTKVLYEYDGNSSEHTFLVGERQIDNNGVEYTNFTSLKHWDGSIPHQGDWVTVVGEFDQSKLKVTATTPYKRMRVTDFNLFQKDFPKETVARWLYPVLGFFVIVFLYAKYYWNMFKLQ